MFFVNLFVMIISLAIGGTILFVGRKAIWITLGMMSFIVTGRLLAVFFIEADKVRDLIEMQSWELIGIAVLVGILGIVIGRVNPNLAVSLVGFLAGTDVALWFYDISAYTLTVVAQQSEKTAFWVGIIVLAIGGLAGLWLVQKARDEALILITMLVGVQLIQNSLGLSGDSSWTAIFLITLGLAGILVQYAGYLREIKSDKLTPEAHPSSLAYFQDLEID